MAADMTDARTMSEAFKLASRDPVLGPILIATWGTLTAHVFGLLPTKYDPFHRISCIRRCVHGKNREIILV